MTFFIQTVDGFRTVVFTRPFKGLSDDHYTFDPVKTTAIPVIMASGKSLNFAYHGHKHRGGEYINLIASGAPTCVCNVGMAGKFNHDAKENKLTKKSYLAGTINYMDFPAPLFDGNCLKEPKGDLDQQDNPTCSIDKYQGGLECCRHKAIQSNSIIELFRIGYKTFSHSPVLIAFFQQ